MHTRIYVSGFHSPAGIFTRSPVSRRSGRCGPRACGLAGVVQATVLFVAVVRATARARDHGPRLVSHDNMAMALQTRGGAPG